MFRVRKLGYLRNLPKSRKLLQENAGQLLIHILPTVKFYCQRWSLPSLSLQDLPQATPFVQRPVHGTKLTFSSLTLTFRVDQNMENYLEVWDWMIGLAPPVTPLQHKRWTESNTSNLNNFQQKGSYSDATLITFTNQENPNMEITFRDLFPISLSEVNFDTTTQTAEEIVCTATFAYRDYEFSVRKVTV